ncbi:hypothetical protein IMSAGC009_03142 [Lachnospiraceae bacterium]|jgi:hypothetical protein|nr:hypothetical protein IMSAGC009_03142 [Lachnospiraceae bacterium]
MIKKNVRYLTGAFVVMAMLCGLYGCSSIDGSEDIGQGVIEAEDKKNTEQDSFSETEEITPNEEHNDTEKAASDGNSDTAEPNTAKPNTVELDVVEPNAADDDWYMRENIFIDDKGNRLEVSFDDYGMLYFAVNGLTLYSAEADNFQQENNWRVYTCDDDTTMIIYYPDEPARLEITNGDYAGLYEISAEKIH